MRITNKEVKENGHVILTVEKTSWFGKKLIKYLATREYPTGYWNWKQLPFKKTVPDAISFTLDELCRNYKS